MNENWDETSQPNPKKIKNFLGNVYIYSMVGTKYLIFAMNDYLIFYDMSNGTIYPFDLKQHQYLSLAPWELGSEEMLLGLLDRVKQHNLVPGVSTNIIPISDQGDLKDIYEAYRDLIVGFTSYDYDIDISSPHVSDLVDSIEYVNPIIKNLIHGYESMKDAYRKSKNR